MNQLTFDNDIRIGDVWKQFMEAIFADDMYLRRRHWR